VRVKRIPFVSRIISSHPLDQGEAIGEGEGAGSLRVDRGEAAPTVEQEDLEEDSRERSSCDGVAAGSSRYGRVRGRQ